MNTEKKATPEVPVLDDAMFELMMAKLQGQIQDGVVSPEHLKAFQKAVKPKTKAQLDRESAISAIADFKTLTEFSEYQNFGQLIADFEILQGELKTARQGGGKKATKKWTPSGPVTDFCISIENSDGEDAKMYVHPEANPKWRQEMVGHGYTDGQAADVGKRMPWRKDIGYMTLEEIKLYLEVGKEEYLLQTATPEKATPEN